MGKDTRCSLLVSGGFHLSGRQAADQGNAVVHGPLQEGGEVGPVGSTFQVHSQLTEHVSCVRVAPGRIAQSQEVVVDERSEKTSFAPENLTSY